MGDRRSMYQALKMTPRATEFIKNGLPKSFQDTDVLASEGSQIVVAHQTHEATTLEKLDETTSKDARISETPTQPKKEKSTQAKTKDSPSLITPVVPLTIRFKMATAEALRRASGERKLEGLLPYAQQHIVEVAVADWLTKNGYLK